MRCGRDTGHERRRWTWNQSGDWCRHRGLCEPRGAMRNRTAPDTLHGFSRVIDGGFWCSLARVSDTRATPIHAMSAHFWGLSTERPTARKRLVFRHFPAFYGMRRSASARSANTTTCWWEPEAIRAAHSRKRPYRGTSRIESISNWVSGCDPGSNRRLLMIPRQRRFSATLTS